MRKLLTALIAAVLASGAFAAGHVAFPDIPEGHWAGDAVMEIADLGIVIGFPDGTFRGNEAFTRYQSALVISRLLAVVEDNMDAAMAMTNSDIASLRNAVQELAADVAAQGVRISAAEGAVAGLSDDTSANAARLDELEAMIANMDMEIDPAVLRDLQNQIASQRVAIDTAQATADAAAGDAAEAQARANAAASSAAGNAAEIAALNELIQILSGQIDALEADMMGMGSGPAYATADAVAALEGDIANIREFVILLRRDQVALRDSVSALEASDSQQTADIADLQDRVTALEANPLDLSGSIEVSYFVGRADGAGDVFDIDRAYGLNAMRDIGASTFSSGTDEELAGDDEEVDEPGEYAQDRADISYESEFSADLSLSFSGGSQFDGEGSPRGLNSFSVVFEAELEELEDANGETFWAITPGDFTTTFDPIGAAPLTFAFGEEVTGSFTPYTLNLEDVGFVATVGSPDFLAFLNPNLWVAYLTDAVTDSYVTTGIRGTLSPLDGVTGGFSLVRNADNTGDKGDELANNLNDMIWGLDAQASLGLGILDVDLAAEYASASIDDGAYSDSILFVTADTMVNILGGVDLGANYRDIALDWEASLGSGVSLTDEDDYPFEDDQTGFGVTAGLSLFIFDVGAYFDSYSVDAGDEVSAFGVDVSADLFRAFSVNGFFDQVSVNGAVADDNSVAERDNDYETGFGVGVEHDGSADNALIPMLNIAAGYEQYEEDFSDVRIYAEADYTLSVSIVTVTPYVSWESNVDSDAGTDDVVELMVGTGLTTEPLDVFFQPSLEAAANYRTASHEDADVFTSTELQYSVGLNLGEFLLPYSSLTARYGSWTGTNVTGDIAGDAGTDISDGDFNNGDNTESVSGFEVEWNYYDLVFSYGVYNYESAAGDVTGAQAFEVAYTVDF